MHPLNKWRLAAGIAIDPKLEMIVEKKAKKDYNKDGKVESEKDEYLGSRMRAAKKEGDLKEAHMGSAFPGCENEEAGKTKYTKGKKYPGLEKCPPGRKNKKCDDVMEMMGGYEMEEQPDKFRTGNDFRQGQRVMYDNGIWIVYVQDAKADMIGVIPPSMKSASKEEKDKAVQMVKPDKLRKMSQEEEEAVGARSHPQMEGTFSLDAVEGAKNAQKKNKPIATGSIAKAAASANAKKALSRGDNKKAAKERLTTGKGADIKESMHTYQNDMYSLSHANDNSQPINSVAQNKGEWEVEPKGELPAQLDARGDASMGDYETNIRVPSQVTSALREAATTLRKEAEKQGMGHTAQANKIFYENAAAAFETLLTLLQEGSIQSVKKAQIHAMTLMGPMIHKLPESVWNFLTTGGQRRGLKSYMTDVSKKYPKVTAG